MRTRLLATLLPALALVALPAAAVRPHLEKATLELAADRTAYEPGNVARVASLVDVEHGWHVNSHQPTFEYLIPTAVELEPPGGWQVLAIDYPKGEMQTFAFVEVPISVYDGQVAIEAHLQVPDDAPPGRAEVTARLTYQACDDSQCLPPMTTVRTLALRVGPGGEATATTAFGAVDDGGPRAAALLPILLLALLGGLILNAMPCVLPVLSLKVFGMVRSAGEGRRAVVAGSLATAAGIVISFWALATAAVVAKAAGAAVGWGVQFQNPVFVTVLAVVVVLFSLNLWGLFEIPLPGFVSRVGGGGGEGVGGHFTSGLFATLMATPCSAPFLGTALGFALSQRTPTILLVFTAVGIGMSLPYLALAAFPGTARLLPRPGPWMDLFKGLMGFLLAGAAVWLLYVLAAQVSAPRLAAIELALLALALFVWLRHRSGGPLARRAAAAGLAATVALALALPLGAGAGEGPGAGAGQEDGRGLIAWTPFDRAQAEALAGEGRLVFVDVTADWCFTCKFNEKLVLETPEVAGAFERHGVVAMRADWTNRNDEIGDYLAAFGRYGIPFYALYGAGDEPHVFSELLTKDAVLSALAAAPRGEVAALAR